MVRQQLVRYMFSESKDRAKAVWILSKLYALKRFTKTKLISFATSRRVIQPPIDNIRPYTSIYIYWRCPTIRQPGNARLNFCFALSRELE